MLLGGGGAGHAWGAGQALLDVSGASPPLSAKEAGGKGQPVYQPPAMPPPSPSWSLGCEGSLGRGLAAPPALHPRLPQREGRPSRGASGSGGQGPPALPSSDEAPQQQDVNGGEGRWAKLAVTHPCRGAPGTGT